MKFLLGLIFIGGIVIGVVLLLRRLWMQSAVQQRWEDFTQPVVATSEVDQDDRWWLSRWLFLAGFRRSGADVIFIAVTLTLLLLGTLVAVGIRWSGIQRLMEVSIVQVPGGVGETFLPVIWVAPWMLLIILTATPWLVVRAIRRKRVELVEQDLPMALELLSTLSEAGLGFDAALSRILKTRLAGRPLAEELRRFQADLLAGRPRTQSLRRFSSRLDIASVSVFTSAMVQAEQLGMGIARVLRLQADDVRARRRERSIAFANALPTKRVIPLVVCFLPGLFVWTLGPAFVQLFKMAETFIQTR